jgi:RNA-binding protein YlmH
MLEARLSDAIARTEKGMTAVLPYLTPRQKKQAEQILRQQGLWGSAYFYGGYPTAERTCLFLLPDYLPPLLSLPIHECPAEELASLIGEEISQWIFPVRIKGSGYRELTHRDYLGSLLGLGLERDALGDVAVQNNREAVVFCSRTIGEFLLTSLSKVASDTVRCTPYVPDEGFTDGRSYRPIHDTVASPRLDCVVAALTNLSREDAQGTIRSGLVEVDFEPTERTDLPLTPPATLSIRGHGRYILRSFDGETRKGRLRMFAEKLI